MADKDEMRELFPYVIREEHIDQYEFECRLVEYASAYIDEIARAIMLASDELWQNDAIVYLVNEWYDEHQAADACRKRYLQEYSRYGYDPVLPPYETGSWHRDNEKFLRQALDALLIHRLA